MAKNKAPPKDKSKRETQDVDCRTQQSPCHKDYSREASTKNSDFPNKKPLLVGRRLDEPNEVTFHSPTTQTRKHSVPQQPERGNILFLIIEAHFLHQGRLIQERITIRHYSCCNSTYIDYHSTLANPQGEFTIRTRRTSVTVSTTIYSLTVLNAGNTTVHLIFVGNQRYHSLQINLETGRYSHRVTPLDDEDPTPDEYVGQH